MKCDVGELVSTADDISNKGEKYKQQVAPRIQSVTTEYSELCSQAKVGFHLTFF